MAAIQANPHSKPKSLTASKDEKTVLFDPAAQKVLKDLVPIISVFARHAPR
jgi:hypothetical protein